MTKRVKLSDVNKRWRSQVKFVNDIFKGQQLKKIAENLDPVKKEKAEAKLLKEQKKIEAKADRQNYLRQIRKDNRSIVMVLGTLSFFLLYAPITSSFSGYVFLVFLLSILYFILEPVTHFFNFVINFFRKILNKKER